MTHFKDKQGINSRIKELDNLHALAEICKKAFGKHEIKIDYMKKELIGSESQRVRQNQLKNRDYCHGCETYRLTEKRICRCMYYFNNGSRQEYCKNCKLDSKWKNIGTIRIVDYEVPTTHITSQVGRIDLLLEVNGKEYGAELKTIRNRETLSRMVAEALTYNLDKKTLPAIAVFEGSYQYKKIQELVKSKNSDWNEITKHVKVFYIYIADKTEKITSFKIEDITHSL